MATICPTVLAGNQNAYREQINRIAAFAERVHIDVMDGVFAPHKSIEASEVWWPAGMKSDIHLMCKVPAAQLDDVIAIKPDLLIIHAEADGNFLDIADALKDNGIKVGLALLAGTPLPNIEPVLDDVDHVLIFSGDLGSFGGQADMGLINKVRDLRKIKPSIEIGWDGGVNEHNVRQLVEAGVDVLNVGGFIQRSDHPTEAYARLKALVQEDKHD